MITPIQPRQVRLELIVNTEGAIKEVKCRNCYQPIPIERLTRYGLNVMTCCPLCARRYKSSQWARRHPVENHEKWRRWYMRHQEREVAKATERQQKRRATLGPKLFSAITRGYVKSGRDKVRQAILEKFGGRCARCGFNDFRALQIDHIVGGGTEARRNIGSIYKLYKAVLEDKTGKYQLLCANCNWIKRSEENELEHAAIRRRLYP